MYRQSLDNLKLAIISLDGVMTSLNRLRYNYCRNYAEKMGKKIDAQEFSDMICSQYTMYDHLPFADAINVHAFSAQLEKELFDYMRFKGFKYKEGIYELFKALTLKNIKICVISTHSKSDAVEYLVELGLYDQCSYVIGSDTNLLPLPSKQVFDYIQDRFKVKNNEVLVLSSFKLLNQAASSKEYNIIYIEDIVKPSAYEKKTSYACVKDLVGAIDLLLFEQYDNSSIYSSILGLNAEMTYEELTNKYNELKELYADDAKIINIVEDTYNYYLSVIPSKPTHAFDELEEKFTSVKDLEEDITEEESKLPEILLKSKEEIIEEHFEEPKEEVVEEVEEELFEEPAEEVIEEEIIEEVPEIEVVIEEEIEVEEEVIEEERKESSIHQLTKEEALALTALTTQLTNTYKKEEVIPEEEPSPTIEFNDTIDDTDEDTDIPVVDENEEDIIEETKVVEVTKEVSEEPKEEEKKTPLVLVWISHLITIILIDLLLILVGIICDISFESFINSQPMLVETITNYINFINTYVITYTSKMFVISNNIANIIVNVFIFQLGVLIVFDILLSIITKPFKK